VGRSHVTDRVVAALMLYQRLYVGDEAIPVSRRKALRRRLDEVLREMEVDESAAYYYGVRSLRREQMD